MSVIDAGLVSRWAMFFGADRAAALAYRAELHCEGLPRDPEGQAKQLGLSVALTEPEFRCEHYGDRRHCPWCAQGRVAAEVKTQEREAKHRRELETKDAAIKRQSEALDNAYAYVHVLERRLRASQQATRSRLRAVKP
jgi:hypothetical protein